MFASIHRKSQTSRKYKPAHGVQRTSLPIPNLIAIIPATTSGTPPPQPPTPPTPSTIPTKHFHPITQFPKSRRSSRSVRIIILIEPVSQNTARGLQTADLNAFAAPALFAVEDGECRPADCEVGVVGERGRFGSGGG